MGTQVAEQVHRVEQASPTLWRCTACPTDFTSRESAEEHQANNGERLALPASEPDLLVMANRLLAELGGLAGERRANAAAEQIQIESLRARNRMLDEPLARRQVDVEQQLRAIYAQLPRRGKAKSRRLAFGIIGERTKARRVEVTDVDRVIAAVKENAEPDIAALIVRRVEEEKLDHKALTNYMAANQWAELPGTLIHEESESFYATPDIGSADPVLDPRD